MEKQKEVILQRIAFYTYGLSIKEITTKLYQYTNYRAKIPKHLEFSIT